MKTKQQIQTYRVFKETQQKEFNKFPLGVAFDKAQLKQMRKDLPLKSDTDKYLSIGAGCFIRKSDEAYFDQLNAKLKAEKKEFIKNNFYEAVLYELQNHEFCYTYDETEALEALGLTIDDLTESQLKDLDEAKNIAGNEENY